MRWKLTEPVELFGKLQCMLWVSLFEQRVGEIFENLSKVCSWYRLLSESPLCLFHPH
ncbi:unnamed protein product [Haemonchus placei]|uniref:Uncharacterized protein n=1 Tax=Haemonchus placei TaxID=6290 RepID=A0A0N4X979_HAEPC|nr:unnamed protein product [Haemonchus placei]